MLSNCLTYRDLIEEWHFVKIHKKAELIQTAMLTAVLKAAKRFT
ncbi:hypothetical protein J3R74_001094 [Puniceicoccus vermicola]